MTSFGAYARYYDLLYRDKDYVGEARYVHDLIQQYSPGARSILDLGCGTGAHAEQFARLGYRVHGIDSGKGMLEQAQARLAGLEPDLAERLVFSAGDLRSFRSDGQFDAVTALFHVVSYQLGNEDITRAFETAASHLAPGGIFIFDFWYGPAVLRDPPVVRVKRMEDDRTHVLRVAEPTMHFNKNVAEVDYQVFVTDRAGNHTEEIREQHLMRYLFLPELQNYARKTGFELIHFSEWMSDTEPSDKTWNAVIVARSTIRGD